MRRQSHHFRVKVSFWHPLSHSDVVPKNSDEPMQVSLAPHESVLQHPIKPKDAPVTAGKKAQVFDAGLQ
jgi:hypothetical protein